mmetsp:Transcript_24658/g.29774  ORF Transcript_24658/g.29774 Transcript_24658/m.29774 type:complete len:217 (-) Transcript_24658:339-989(-)
MGGERSQIIYSNHLTSSNNTHPSSSVVQSSCCKSLFEGYRLGNTLVILLCHTVSNIWMHFRTPVPEIHNDPAVRHNDARGNHPSVRWRTAVRTLHLERLVREPTGQSSRENGQRNQRDVKFESGPRTDQSRQRRVAKDAPLFDEIFVNVVGALFLRLVGCRAALLATAADGRGVEHLFAAPQTRHRSCNGHTPRRVAGIPRSDDDNVVGSVVPRDR